MSLTDTRHLSVVIGGKDKTYASDNLKIVRAQCEDFSSLAFGPVDPVKSVCALIKAGEAIAPLMSRDEIGRLIGVLEQKMRSRARTR